MQYWTDLRKPFAASRKVETRTVQRLLRFDTLEDRRLLSITWANKGTSNVVASYSTNGTIVEQLVQRAIDDWNAVIQDFNYDNDNNPLTDNTFSLSVVSASLSSSTARGETNLGALTTAQQGRRPNLPISATIRMDDNGGGTGWFFDSTPFDDAEFTAIANTGSTSGASFHASFVDITSGAADFYRTIVHEIGHALGLASSSPVFSTASPQMTFIGADPLSSTGGALYSFRNPTGLYGVTATITTDGGRHLYEVNHPNDLMNPGRITPVGSPRETTRQLISDFDVQLLVDAYGYTHTLPSSFNTAHVTLDSQTGTLLIQGGVATDAFGRNDTFDMDEVGTDIVARVNNAYEKVPTSQVNQIVLAWNGGFDTFLSFTLPAGIPIYHVQYVVSTNVDSADVGNPSDFIVDEK